MVATATRTRNTKSAKASNSAIASKSSVKNRPIDVQSHTIKTRATSNLTNEQRVEMISTAAYFIAEKRGFKDGDPQDDWLVAESQFDEMTSP